MDKAKDALNQMGEATGQMGEAAGEMVQQAQSAVGLGGKKTEDDVSVPAVDTDKAKEAVLGHGQKGGADAKEAAAKGDVKGTVEGVKGAAEGVVDSLGSK